MKWKSRNIVLKGQFTQLLSVTHPNVILKYFLSITMRKSVGPIVVLDPIYINLIDKKSIYGIGQHS